MTIARGDIRDLDAEVYDESAGTPKLWMILRLDISNVDIDNPMLFGSEEWQFQMESAHAAYLAECKAQRELRGRDRHEA